MHCCRFTLEILIYCVMVFYLLGFFDPYIIEKGHLISKYFVVFQIPCCMQFLFSFFVVREPSLFDFSPLEVVEIYFMAQPMACLVNVVCALQKKLVSCAVLL